MSTLTKLFIVLQLVFSIALSVIVVMVVSAQPKYKDQVEAWQKATIAAQAALAREVSNGVQLNTTISTLNATIKVQAAELADSKTATANQIASLEKNISELNTKITEITATNTVSANIIASLKEQLIKQTDETVRVAKESIKNLNRAEEVNRLNDKLTQENSQVIKALRLTQERLIETEQKLEALRAAPKQSAGAGGGSSIGQAVSADVAHSETPINGPVGKIDTMGDRTYFTLTLGTRDGLQKGMTLIISRGSSYIGDAEIVNTKVNEAVAMVKMLKSGQSVQTGDLVTVTR